MPNTFDIEDDMIQEADTDTGSPDSLVDAVTPGLKEDEEIELAKPLETISGEVEPNTEQPAENPPAEPTEGVPATPEEPVANETSYDEIVDDVKDTPVPETTEPSPGFEGSDSAPLGGDTSNNVPDTTPDPDDKDQGTFEGPMKYQPLYQRRNETDLTGFGTDYTGETPSNQYDTSEIDTINELVASEASAMDEYMSAAKKSKQDTLQRLYSDIANEERFHLEQLLYAKSVITGEKYIPRDPDVKNEYKELIALGMDEETAMTTAVDKVGLMPQNVTPEDVHEAGVEVIEMKEYFISVVRETSMVLESLTDDGKLDSEASETIVEAYNDLMGIDDTLIQEAMDNMGDTSKGFNPITYLIKVVKKIYDAIIRFVKKIKVYIAKFFAKNRVAMEWIKANGIKGLFKDGINLYFFDPKQSDVDMPHIAAYCKLALDVTQRIAENCNCEANVKINPNVLGTYTPIRFKTIDEGVTYLKGTAMVKSKVVIDDKNEEAMEALFFGVSVNRIGVSVLDQDRKPTGKVQDVSRNVYNQYQRAIQYVSDVLNVINAVLDRIEDLAAINGSVYHTKRLEVYDPSVKAMGSVVKCMEKMAVNLTHDVEECIKINNGLLELTREADIKTGINVANGHFKKKDLVQAVDAQGNVKRSHDSAVMSVKSGIKHPIK